MEIKVLSHGRFGKVRCLTSESGRAFVAVDLAAVLGYVKVESLIQRYVSRDDTLKEWVTPLSGSGKRRMLLVNENGLRSIIEGVMPLNAADLLEWLLGKEEALDDNADTPALIPQIFNHPRFGNLRVVSINDDFWFVGKDVAAGLECKNTTEAVRYHVDERDKREEKILLPSGVQSAILINMSGIYSLVLDSQMPKAKDYRHWVTSEVLPTIDATGAYGSPQTVSVVDLAEFQRQIDELKILFGQMFQAFEQSNVAAQRTLSKEDKAKELIALAEKLQDAATKDKILLHAANILVGKKLF